MRIAGVDGCKAGWVVASANADLSGVEFRLVATFAEIFEGRAVPALVAVDMPMGFLDKAEDGGRECERALRKILGKGKTSSVFPSPARAALKFELYEDACRANRENSLGKPKGLPKQTHGIFKKMNELDRFVRARSDDAIFECHPEYAFALMRGKTILESKKTAAGLALRDEALAASGIALPTNWRSLFKLRDAAPDDVLDAAACLWSAARIRAGKNARVPPGEPARDREGIRMAIHA